MVLPADDCIAHRLKMLIYREVRFANRPCVPFLEQNPSISKLSQNRRHRAKSLHLLRCGFIFVNLRSVEEVPEDGRQRKHGDDEVIPEFLRGGKARYEVPEGLAVRCPEAPLALELLKETKLGY